MTKVGKSVNSIVSLLLVLVCTLSLSTNTFAATWRTGEVPAYDHNTSAIVVKLSNTNKSAAVKIHAYVKNLRGVGVEKNCSFTVTMRDNNNKWIWEGKISTGRSGKKMKLGNDHKVYKLYLSHRTYRSKIWGLTEHYDVGHNCPDFWGVECISNCSVN